MNISETPFELRTQVTRKGVRVVLLSTTNNGTGMKRLLTVLGVLLVAGCGASGSNCEFARTGPPDGEFRIEDGQPSFVPTDGLLPDAQVAICVADAVLSAIYGSDVIESQRPLRATINDDIWVVEGTLPPNHVGGTALIEIAKGDGRILRVVHYE